MFIYQCQHLLPLIIMKEENKERKEGMQMGFVLLQLAAFHTSFLLLGMQKAPLDPFRKGPKPAASHGVPLGGMGYLQWLISIV